MSQTTTALRQALEAELAAGDVHALGLNLGGCSVRVETNHAQLVVHLRRYFRPFLLDEADTPSADAADVHVVALDRDPPDWGLEFVDWRRDPGKVGRKDAYADLPDGRVVWKVRTGMQYVLDSGTKTRWVVGPCMVNDNQVINFVVAQHLTWGLHRDHVLCHSAAVVKDGKGVAMCAFSGSGKSTLALHLMDQAGFSFCSNDRLMVGRGADGPRMLGVPKHPRINPGTALSNPALDGLVAPERAAELRTWPKAELWALEEKLDVLVDEVFGPERLQLSAPLDALLILTWKPSHEGPPTFERIELTERPHLMAAIMKSPGVFYEPPDGRPPRGQSDPVPEPYLAAFRGVPVYELSGGVDFDAGVRFVTDEVLAR